jgi:hypothetical protein
MKRVNKWLFCFHGMARPHAAEGEGLRVAANLLNKQSLAAEKGLSSNLGIGQGLTTPHRKKNSILRNVAQGLGRILKRPTKVGCNFSCCFAWV